MKRAGLLLSLAMLLASCGTPQSGAGASATAPPRVIKLKAPYTAISVAQSPVWVANDTRLFEKHGLDVELTKIDTSTTLVPAMLSGEVGLAAGAEEAVISAGLTGADLVMIASGPTRVLFSIYARPGIGGLADLKGKKLGVTKTGASTDFAARYVLRKSNLTPDRDVTIVQMGGVPEILAALKGGQIDAGVLSPPTTFAAAKAGMQEVIDISKQDLAFYQGAIISSKSWLKDNREAASRYLKAYTEAIALMHREPAKAESIIGKYSRITDPEILSKSVKALLPVLPVDQTPKLDAVKTGLEQAAVSNPRARDADPTRFIDPTLMQDLVKSGFIKALRTS